MLRRSRPKSKKERLEERGRQLRASAAELDIPWVRSLPAWAVRESVLWVVLAPIMLFYLRRKASGATKLGRVRGPVIFAANHTSHLDTPVILAALPRRFRKRTVVAAAADYFYSKRPAGTLVSLLFNTVPMDRSGGGLEQRACAHVDELLDDGWSLLLYPEGTRSRSGSPGRARRGAAVLAKRHGLLIVPIRVTGTRDAMPPGRFWPRRRHRKGRVMRQRHPVSLTFGDPIVPRDDAATVIETVQEFFENGPNGSRPGPASDAPSSSGEAPMPVWTQRESDEPSRTLAHH